MAGGNIPPQLLPVFQAAGHAENIPASVLAGIASVESNMGSNLGPSSTGAYGWMQFEPGTAHGLGVNVRDPRSEIFGAARLLNQYGYQQNPARAIGAYNGGPGNPQYGYARQVLAESQRLSKEIRGAGGLPAMPALAAGGVQQVPGAQPTQPSGPSPASIAETFFKDSTNPFGGSTGGLGHAVSMVAAHDAAAANPTQHMVLTAQRGLQQLAGTIPLNVHPAAGPAGAAVARMTKLADALVGKPYVWGGGHGGWGPQPGYDCSGFISAVLHAAGYLQAPQSTQTLASAPGIQNGPGRHVTIYDRTDGGSPSNDHVIIDINGSWFESGGNSAQNPSGGVARIAPPPQSYLTTFNRTLHPQGL